jgi:hypothetical protein
MNSDQVVNTSVDDEEEGMPAKFANVPCEFWPLIWMCFD